MLESDTCCWCLTATGAWDVDAPYISDNGTKEVYSEMLRECLGINMQEDFRWRRLVCSPCVGHLKDACAFKSQVQRAEINLADSFRRKKILDSEINVEEVIQKKNKERKGQKTENIKSKKRIDDDSDSDVPIADLFGGDVSEEGTEAVEHQDSKEIVNESNMDIIDTQNLQDVKKIPKHISERKRGILTCNTVISETTACPFRHHKSWFQCFFCSQDFIEINLLKEHTKKSHGDIEMELKNMKRFPRSLQIEISNLECRSCQLSLTDVKETRRHLLEVHNKVIYTECIADFKINKSPYSCHMCEQKFHVFRTLTTHLNEHYANCICDVCGKSYLNSKRLKVHKRIHECGNYPCAECGRVLKTKVSLSNHIENAHSKRQMKCQICDRPVKHYNDRIKHMSTAHNITHKFQCPICGREYNVKHYLATHIRQTHGHKNKKCSQCCMSFITNHSLKKHMLKHTGEKPFACIICGKSFARSYTLKEHLRTHDNARYASND